MNFYRSDKNRIFIFLLPALIIYVFFAIVPIIQSVYFSFFDWPGIYGVPLKFNSINNFVSMFKSSLFAVSLKNMVQFMIISIVIQIFIGYALAIMLGTFCKGFKLFKTFFFIPVVIPLTATALLWRFLYMPGDTGVINFILNIIGLGEYTTMWLVDSKTVMNSIIVANSWTGLGYHMMIGFAAISSIPAEIIEASEIDGATGLRKITNIIIPMIWEALRISVVLIIIGSVKIFDIIYIMTKGGPDNITQVPATLLYFEAFQYDNYGFGSAISVFILVTSILLAIISLKLTQKEKIEF